MRESWHVCLRQGGGVVESRLPPIRRVVEFWSMPYHLLVAPLVIINERPLRWCTTRFCMFVLDHSWDGVIGARIHSFMDGHNAYIQYTLSISVSSQNAPKLIDSSPYGWCTIMMLSVQLSVCLSLSVGHLLNLCKGGSRMLPIPLKTHHGLTMLMRWVTEIQNHVPWNLRF